MKIYYTCSNCGQHFQTSAMMGVPDGMYFSGCRVVGDAFYCEDCVKTWADRNGKPFDEQYADPRGMFTKWWNRMVDEQAKVEGKTVKKYRVVNGEYITECEITECDYHDACKVRGQTDCAWK